ncbi:hypothetical protein IJT17_01420 [bacterium]|nr:hypothetical protein [bacterium]
MATIGTQSFSRLVGVRKNKTGEAVSLRRALADPILGAKVLANFRFITPQYDVLRAFASSALSGGSVALAGAGGTGKSSLMFALGRLLTVDYPSDEFTKLSDVVQDVHLVRALAGLRTAGRNWLIAVPDFSSGDFSYAMRGAINGALLSSDRTSEFVPQNDTLVAEYSDTAAFLHEQGSFDGLLILGDNFEGILSDCATNADGDNAQALREFTGFCASSPFPVLFVVAVERDLSSLSVAEEDLLLDTFQKVQPVTLLGKSGEWEDLVAATILYHPEDDIWSDAVDYKDFRSIVEGTVRQGLYAGNSDKWLNDTVVCGAYPIHPAALFALPRVAMNLSSSTKTAFRFFTDEGPGGLAYFLNNYAVVQPNGRLNLYTVDWLCTYFEKVIQTDAHNSFYTAALQNAILAAGDVPQSRRILRLIMIMQLIGHDRLRPQLETIIWALHLGEREERTVRHSLTLLLQKKALEYSEATKEYLLPVPRHEVNVPQAVQRSRNRMRAQLDLRQELQTGLHSLRIKARGYNERYCTDRCGAMRAFLSSDVCEPSHFFEVVDDFVGSMSPYRGDVLFAFVIPNSESDMQDIIERIKEGKYNHPRLVMAVPKQAHRFASDILEVRTLERMLSLEPPFSDSTTAEHAQIERMLKKVTSALDGYANALLDHENVEFYYNGDLLAFKDDEQVENWLDDHLPKLVGTPPLIASAELMSLCDSGLNRRNRQSLIYYLLVTGDSIAIRSDARSIKNMVEQSLVRTGILCETMRKGFWTHYALNNEIPDTGLGKAFNTIVSRILETAETDTTVCVRDLVRPWMAAPHAMTPALMELLLAVIMWRWPREIKLFNNNLRAQAESRPDLLTEAEHTAENVADMVANSSDWVICYSEADKHQKRYLEGICSVAGVSAEHEGSFWNYAAKALLNWYRSLDASLREPALIKTQELQRFNLCLANAAAQDNRLREFLENKLPTVLGEPAVFSWVAEADTLVNRLKDISAKLAGQIAERRELLEKELAQAFASEEANGKVWFDEAERWLAALKPDTQIGVWQSDYDALKNALAHPLEERLDALVVSLGYPEMRVWKNDCAADIAERMKTMRYALDWEYYCRSYRIADVQQAAASLGLDVLRASGLSREGIEELLELYLRAIAWPEAMDEAEDELASVIVADSLAEAETKDVGDWLYEDSAGIMEGLPVVAPADESDDLGIAGLEWELDGSDFLESDAEDEEYEEDVPEVAVADESDEAAEAVPQAEPKRTSGLSFDLAALVSRFSKARADADKEKEAEPAEELLSSEGGDEAAAAIYESGSAPVQAEEAAVETGEADHDFASLGFMSHMAQEMPESNAAQEIVSEPTAEPEESNTAAEASYDDDLDDLTLQWL